MSRDVVVIGGSAGALEPLKTIVAALPADIPASVVVVTHLAATAKSALAPILSRVGGPQAVVARDGDPLRPGYVYVPTPDRHLELRDGVVRVTRGPKVNGARPSIDVLFRSAAREYGARVAGVILSGGLDDGSAGLAAIRAAGGLAIVQRPEDALLDSMPRNAIRVADPEHVLPVEEIGPLLVRVVRQPAPKTHVAVKGEFEMQTVGADDTPGRVTGMTCPDCHGSIWLQKGDGGEVAFTCRVGHSYSPESFFEIQAANVENALWAAVRSLEEQGALAGAMAQRASNFDGAEAVDRFESRRKLSNEHAEVIRGLLTDRTEA